MSPIKVGCRYLPPCCKNPRPRGEQPDWKEHPSWTAGLEALEDYNRWVSEVVLPIAFQWIEEHKPDVYATVPQELADDVGVVVASAFALVKLLPAYQQGLDKCREYEEALAGGTFDASKINPVWTGIAQKIRADTKEAFAKQSSVLGDTIP